MRSNNCVKIREIQVVLPEIKIENLFMLCYIHKYIEICKYKEICKL